MNWHSVIKKAFTMLEMMVVIFLIGLLATIMLPRFVGQSKKVSWPSVLSDLNNIISFARQEAIMHRKIYRLTFVSKSKGRDFVLVEEEKMVPDDAEKKKFEPVVSPYFHTKYFFDHGVTIQSFYLGTQFVSEDDNRGKYFCYILPDGLVQDVTLHLNNQEQAGKKNIATFKSMPFLGTFTMQMGLVKPSVRGVQS